jgi:hypothetical protein
VGRLGQEQRVQRIEADEVSSGVCGNRREAFEILEIADAQFRPDRNS